MDTVQMIAEMVARGNAKWPDRKREQRQWFTMKAGASDTADLSVYDEVGFWGTTAAAFKDALASVKGKTLNVSINSPGGDVFDGFAIYNMLKAHDGEVTTTIDGYAASIASVIAMAGSSKPHMAQVSYLMIHNPAVMLYGDANALREEAALLDEIKARVIEVYQTYSNLDTAEIGAMMDATTWMNADMAAEKGFAQKIEADTDNPVDMYRGRLSVPEHVVVAMSTGLPYTPVSGTPEDIDKPKPKGGDMADNKATANVEPTPTPVQAPTPAPDAKQMREEWKATRKKLRASASALGITDADMIEGIVDRVVDAEITGEQALQELIEKHNSGSTPVPVVTADASDKRREIMPKALMHAGNVATAADKAEVIAAGLGGLTLKAFLRDELHRAGVKRTHMLDGEALVGAFHRPEVRMSIAQGTSDMTNVLENTLNKSLTGGFQTAPVVWPTICGRLTCNDFRATNIVGMSLFSGMETIREGEGFRYGRFSDKKESLTLETKGKAFSLSRQAIVNDDLSAFTRVPRAMGDSMSRQIEIDVLAILYGTAAAGPTMNETSRGMFNTTDGSLASSGGAISQSTLSTGRTAMRRYSALGPSDKQTADVPMAIMPSILFTTATNETVAKRIVGAAYDNTDAQTAESEAPNQFRNLRVVTSPYLDVHSTSVWYLLADPTTYPAMVVGFLRGQETPTTRSETSGVGDPLGITWDVYFDYKPGAVDWRYSYANAGA